MFRFFRSIRKNLINENKTVKYMKYATGEFILVVLGILFALQINNWNEERKGRLEERIILGRVIEELEATITYISSEKGIAQLETMRESLDEVAAAFAGAPIEDPLIFLSHVTTGAKTGWGQHNQRQFVYMELRNSGKFGLIRNAELRDQITQYYVHLQQSEKRASLRVGEYAKLAYELIPRQSENFDLETENRVKEGLTEEEYEALTDAVLNSDLARHIVPLQNRYLLIQALWIGIRSNAKELINQIQSELTS
jgi:hypothetical protein